jgi:hypothetical protein
MLMDYGYAYDWASGSCCCYLGASIFVGQVADENNGDNPVFSSATLADENTGSIFIGLHSRRKYL